MTSNSYLQSVANTSRVSLPNSGDIITPVALASLATILDEVEATVGIGPICPTHYASHELIGTCTSHRTDNSTFHNSFDSGFRSSVDSGFYSSDDNGYHSDFGTAKSVCSGFKSSQRTTVCSSFNFSDFYGRGSGSRGEFCASFTFGADGGYGSYNSSHKSSVDSSVCSEHNGTCSCFEDSSCDVYNFTVATKGAFCPTHYNSGFNATFNFNAAGFDTAACLAGFCGGFDGAGFLRTII